MRWLGLVAALALVACGGADDGEVFGGATSTGTQTVTSTGSGGLVYGTSVCDGSTARLDVPGVKANGLSGRYKAVEHMKQTDGTTKPRLLSVVPHNEFVLAPCYAASDVVEFSPL